jgi:hypothetical protein
MDGFFRGDHFLFPTLFPIVHKWHFPVMSGVDECSRSWSEFITVNSGNFRWNQSKRTQDKHPQLDLGCRVAGKSQVCQPELNWTSNTQEDHCAGNWPALYTLLSSPWNAGSPELPPPPLFAFLPQKALYDQDPSLTVPRDLAQWERNLWCQAGSLSTQVELMSLVWGFVSG